MKKILLTLFLFTFSLNVFGKNNIVIIGDSLSAGYGFEINQGWVAKLQTMLDAAGYDYHVVNLSISGATTSYGVEEIPKALTQYAPKITIIELGGNDGLRGLQLSIIKKNLQQIISVAKEKGSKVLLIGVRLPPNYGLAYTEQFHQIFSELADAEGISVVPFFLNNIDTNKNLMQPDQIHPTAEAQQVLLNNVWPELKKLLTSND